VFPDGMFRAQTPQIIALAARNRLPTMYGLREYAEVGGLMAYGANLFELHRRLSASLVDKILRGAKPADLPIEQPTKFELVIKPQNRQDARPDDSADAAAAGGPGHRVARA
jgi:putative ABC transport system substrate-binding protein